MPEQWRLILDPALPGPVNMERDLALVNAVAAGASRPLLRLYAWSPPALSLGRFQEAGAVADQSACRRLGIDLVRRPTGGRAVLHHRELTYSIVAPEGHPLIPRGVVEAYRLVNRGLVQAFAMLGVDAGLAPAAGRGAGPAPGSCFDIASAYDVLVAGKKVAGSAQLRSKGVFLQHGSILLELPLELYRQVLLPRNGACNSVYLETLGRKSAGLIDLGCAVSWLELAEAVAAGFCQAFSIGFDRAIISATA